MREAEAHAGGTRTPADGGRGRRPSRRSRLGSQTGPPRRSRRAAQRERIGRQRRGAGAHAGPGPTRAGAREPAEDPGGNLGHSRATGEDTTTGSHRHRHEGGPAALPPGTPAGPRHHRGDPSRDPDPTAGGPGATTATSPTPGRHTQDLVHPRPGPAPGDRHAPPWGRFPGPRRPDPSPRTQRGRRHRQGLGTARERAESRLAAEGGHAPDGTPHAPSLQATTSPTARTQGPARRDPPPTQRGEARATVGDERRSVFTAETGGPHFSPPPRRKRELCLHTSESNRHAEALPQRRERRRAGGVRYPQSTPLGSLEKAFSPRAGHTPPPTGRPSPGRPRRRSGTPREGRDEVYGERSGTRGTPSTPRRGAQNLDRSPRRQPSDELSASPRDPHADPMAATGGGGPGGGNDTTARPRAPEGQPGALQEHRKRPKPSQRSHHPGEGSTTGHRDEPPTAAERGRPRQGNNHRRRERGMPAASEDPTGPRQAENGGARRGRAGFRTPYTSRSRPHRQGAGEARGPPRAGREERSHSPRMSVPRPPRIGRGPGERDVTTSIGRDPERGEGVNLSKATEPTGPRPASPAPGKGRRTTPEERRTPDTHGTEPTERGRRDRPRCPQQGAHTQADGSPPARTGLSPPHPGESEETRAQGGTREPGHSDGCTGGKAHGPQPAAQPRAGPASRVTGRPETPHASRGPTSPATGRQRTACQQ